MAYDDERCEHCGGPLTTILLTAYDDPLLGIPARCSSAVSPNRGAGTAGDAKRLTFPNFEGLFRLAERYHLAGRTRFLYIEPNWTIEPFN